jgi:hypothetical protein
MVVGLAAPIASLFANDIEPQYRQPFLWALSLVG